MTQGHIRVYKDAEDEDEVQVRFHASKALAMNGVIHHYGDLANLPPAVVGEKAIGVAELERGGGLVPKGFVIPSSAMQASLERTTAAVGYQYVQSDWGRMSKEVIEGVTERIGEAILEADIDDSLRRTIDTALATLVEETDCERVILRSSSSAEDRKGRAAAGCLDSVVIGASDDWLAALRRCWASAFGARAVSYWTAWGDQSAAPFEMAVLVQEFIAGEASGVLHMGWQWKHVSDLVLVEVVPGTCAPLVLGEVIPQRFLVDDLGGEVLLRPRQEDSCPMPDRDIVAVATQAARIVEAVKGGTESRWQIEWTWRAGKTYFLQMRPL